MYKIWSFTYSWRITQLRNYCRAVKAYPSSGGWTLVLELVLVIAMVPVLVPCTVLSPWSVVRGQGAEMSGIAGYTRYLSHFWRYTRDTFCILFSSDRSSGLIIHQIHFVYFLKQILDLIIYSGSWSRFLGSSDTSGLNLSLTKQPHIRLLFLKLSKVEHLKPEAAEFLNCDQLSLFPGFYLIQMRRQTTFAGVQTSERFEDRKILIGSL